MLTTLLLLGAASSASRSRPGSASGYGFLAVAGFGYLASNTSATSRLQLDVAAHQRGRIMALWSVAFLGLRPIASLTDGAIAGAFGVRAAGVVLAVPALAVALAILASSAAAIRAPSSSLTLALLQRPHRSLTKRA